MLAANHIHSQCEVSSFGEDNCDEAVLGIDATKRFLKITGPPPSLSSGVAKEHTQMAAAGLGLGVGKALLALRGLVISPSVPSWLPRHGQMS